MTFAEIYFQGFLIILIMMTSLWLISIVLKNVSIVDAFWGLGFILAATYYFLYSDGMAHRKLLVLCLVIIWGFRLSIFIGWRNWGKGEDFRYQKFRQDYGPHRYWWLSFFQTFLLQGVLMWLVSAPLLAAQYHQGAPSLGWLDYLAVLIWLIGIGFEAIGDYQMSRFKANSSNKGKVLNHGLWKYTRHPNYFGDAMVWWAFGIFGLAAGNYYVLLAPLLMNILLLKISGVALLEKSLKADKPQYQDYMERTNAFFPWFPKK